MATKKTTTTKRTAKKTARKKVGKKAGTKRAKAATENAALGSMTISEIQGQLKARERKLGTLQRKRKRLITQVAEVESQIAVMTGGKVTGSGGRRPRNEKNLAEALHGVLKGKQMSVTEATQAVLDSGYRTTADNFRIIVNQRLLADKRFEKVGWGVYTCAK